MRGAGFVGGMSPAISADVLLELDGALAWLSVFAQDVRIRVRPSNPMISRNGCRVFTEEAPNNYKEQTLTVLFCHAYSGQWSLDPLAGAT